MIKARFALFESAAAGGVRYFSENSKKAAEKKGFYVNSRRFQKRTDLRDGR